VRLRDLQLKRRYRSNEDDLLSDFYVPCLGAAKQYRRAAGYFSGAVFGLASRGLASFVDRGGEMKLVVSSELRAGDYSAANAGYADRLRVVSESVTGQLRTDARDSSVKAQLGLLGWLIARGQLDIRIAVTADGLEPGIYHEKFGIFTDEDGDSVAFHGSANESRGGMRVNFESIMVFRSWEDADTDDVEIFEREFEALWSNKTPNLDIYDFPEAARRELIALAKETGAGRDISTAPQGRESDAGATYSPTTEDLPHSPAGLVMRDYQRDALGAWFGARGRGILEMATGTGKTVTALVAYERLARALANSGESLLAVVVCPYQHLVQQWAEAARRFGVDPVLCFRSRTSWAGDLDDAVRAVKQRTASTRLVICTNATFQGAYFRSALDDAPPSSLLIADEVHNLGAPRALEALPSQFQYRLALSATPTRMYDEAGTDALFAYFGDVVFKFGLREAIACGALTPYEYGVSVVELEGEEVEGYVQLTARIGRAIGAGGLDGPGAQALLNMRARIIANAHGKISALASAIRPYRETKHNLVYCGDGSTQDDASPGATRQIETVVQLLGRDLGMRVQPYTDATSVEKRAELRSRFEAGDLQSLVAIRCLDEGVDIPETERAFILASSANPRQYVQRRGRVLRPSPATGKTRAYIHDFLAIPPPDALDGGLWELERRIVRRELRRVVEFAELATNGPIALDRLGDLRERYGLLDL
jgi:superfamily II DNA or RNA helicase